MSIFTETFPEFVQDELTIRQKRLSDPAERFRLVTYQSTRNSFVRMTSGVDVEGKPDLAKKYVLQGGTLNGTDYKQGVGESFDKNAYSVNSAAGERYTRGIRPMPGIVSVDAECKTAYGSLFEATVRFVCWDIKQLEDLELLYMRPGYTVLLEWGWAYNGFQPQFYDILDKKEINFTKTNLELFKQCQKNNGNYEAILGYVKNYQWSARPDGGYDCTTTLIALGEVLESLKINYAPLNVDINATSTDNYVGILKKFSLKDSLSSVHGITDAYSQQLVKDYYSKGILSGLLFEIQEFLSTSLFPDASVSVSSNKYPDMYLKSIKGGYKPYSVFKKSWAFKNSPDYKSPIPLALGNKYNYYITLGSLCDLVNEYVIPKNSNNTEDGTLIEIKTTSRTYTGKEAKPLECIAHPLQTSTDPTRVLIKGDLWINRGASILGDAIASASTPVPAGRVSNNVNKIISETSSAKRIDYFIRFITTQAPASPGEPAYPVTKADLIHDFIQLRAEIENTISSIVRGGDGTGIVYNFTEAAGNGNEFRKEITTLPSGQLGFNILKYMGYDSSEALYNDLYIYSSDEFQDVYPKAFLDFIKNSKPDIIDAISSNLQFNNTLGAGIPSSGFITPYALYLERKLTGVIIKEASDKAAKSLKGLQYLKDYFVEGNSYTKGNISNIYVDIDYLHSILSNPNIESKDPSGKNVINLVDLFKNVCQAAQECTGNLNDFSVHIDGRDNKGRIVDLNVDKPSVKLFQLELHNTLSTARNYKLESKIFPEQGAIIAISAQDFQASGQLGYSNSTLTSYNRNIKDRLKPRITTPFAAPLEEGNQILLNTLTNSFAQLNNYFSALSDDAISSKYGPGSFNNALRDLLGFLSSLDPTKLQQFTGIIPVTLSMDIDGIGGIVIGNLFKISDSILPAGYKGLSGFGRQLGFIVKNFHHKIENNDWVTTIEAYPFLIPEAKDIADPSNVVSYWNKFFEIAKTLTSPKPISSSLKANTAPELTPSGLRYPFVGPYTLTSPALTLRVNPVKGYTEIHKGSDLALPSGVEIVAVEDGIVLSAAFQEKGAGNYVQISHTGQLKGYDTVSMHLSKFVVRTGQQVKKGDVIGYSGSTGSSTAPHLHFEMRETSTKNRIKPDTFFPGF